MMDKHWWVGFGKGLLLGFFIIAMFWLGIECARGETTEARHLEGVTLEVHPLDDGLDIHLLGAENYEVKQVQILTDPECTWVRPRTGVDAWVSTTDCTSGVFTAIICTDTLCIPVAYPFDVGVGLTESEHPSVAPWWVVYIFLGLVAVVFLWGIIDLLHILFWKYK